MRYVPEFDGLRCLAFLAVFAAHVFYVAGVPMAPPAALSPADAVWWWRGIALAGFFGVDLFFVLSGFLITTLLLREEATHGRIDVVSFWIRRALRIWPAYYVLLAFAFTFNEMTGGAMAGFATFTENLSLAAGTYAPVNLHVLWSLQIEEQFYFVWPLLLMLAPRRFCPVLGIGLIAASVVVRCLMFSAGATLFTWAFTPARLDALGIGIVLACVPLAPAPRWGKGLGLALPLVAIAGAGLTSQAMRVGDLALNIRPDLFWAAVLIPTAIAGYCGLALWAARSTRWLRWRPLVHLGRISYGLYLIHFTVIGWFASLWWPAIVVLSLAVSVLIAETSYRFLERPFLSLKDRFAPTPPEASDRERPMEAFPAVPLRQQ